MSIFVRYFVFDIMNFVLHAPHGGPPSKLCLEWIQFSLRPTQRSVWKPALRNSSIIFCLFFEGLRTGDVSRRYNLQIRVFTVYFYTAFTPENSTPALIFISNSIELVYGSTFTPGCPAGQ